MEFLRIKYPVPRGGSGRSGSSPGASLLFLEGGFKGEGLAVAVDLEVLQEFTCVLVLWKSKMTRVPALPACPSGCFEHSVTGAVDILF